MINTKYLGLLNNIERYVEINQDEKQAIQAISQYKKVAKKELIVEPGIVCSSQTYVIKGTLRSYFIQDNGDEHTIQFAIDDWFISDFNSYIEQTPASLYVEAITDTEILQLNFDEVEKLCTAYPVFEHFFRRVAQKAFAYAQRRVLSKLGKSAEERYLEFNNMYPSIVQSVPQYALASYLGMTPEFLSKIRNKLASE